jgi:hypothetical protein
LVNCGQKSFITWGPVLEKVFLVTNGFTRIHPQDVVAGYVGRAAVSGLENIYDYSNQGSLTKRVG